MRLVVLGRLVLFLVFGRGPVVLARALLLLFLLQFLLFLIVFALELFELLLLFLLGLLLLLLIGALLLNFLLLLYLLLLDSLALLVLLLPELFELLVVLLVELRICLRRVIGPRTLRAILVSPRIARIVGSGGLRRRLSRLRWPARIHLRIVRSRGLRGRLRRL